MREELRKLKMAQEKSFENKIKAYLKSKNCYYVKFFANSFTRAGVPDILACVNGYWLGIEVKAQKGKASDLQRYNVEQIRAAGGFAYIVYPSGWEKLKAVIDGILIENFNKEEELILK